jgi:uncharacterized 2Fe-2S/4Fe-4S cluster protein (DUF4445 family)/ferredoxin
LNINKKIHKTDVGLRIESDRGNAEVALSQLSGQPNLTEILDHHSLPLNTRCGRRGLCDGCMIELVQGRLANTATGATVAADDAPLLLRGCEHHPLPGEPATVRIPPRSLLAHEPQVVSDFRVNIPFAHDPLFPLIPSPPHPVTPSSPLLAAAIDIGTTTIALLLVDLTTGRIVEKESHFNRQMHLGDDVLTRINLCATAPEMVAKLQQTVTSQTIAPLLHRALRKADADVGQLRGIVVAGNTTMLHLLLGVDPTPMGTVPFTPVFLEQRLASAHALNLLQFDHATAEPAASMASHPADPDSVPVHLLPSAAAYVGADIVAGCLASGLLYDEGPCLLVDIGTNGEIVLKQGDTLTACATAAGPAFEGARLTAGLRAARGAISHLRLHDNPLRIELEVIENDRPIGICGSAYIDFLAEARRIDLIGPTGRFDDDAFSRPGKQLIRDDHGARLRVARGRGGRDIAISEGDIASLLQAKAAIAAGILTLLEQASLQPLDIKTLYLAGGFGLHLNRQSAIDCGLLPGFTLEQVQVVGNTSLAGAYLSMLDRSLLNVLQQTAAKIEIIELNLAPGFEDRYIEQLMLP